MLMMTQANSIQAAQNAPPDSTAKAREIMVEQTIQSRGISDPTVLKAMRRVKRHLLIPEETRSHAYADRPLPIGMGQTISQPYIVALMTELLAPQPEHTILEVGTGSGYQACVLAEIVSKVYTIEIIPELSLTAQQVIRDMGYQNIHYRIGDGYLGWPEVAPFDGIIVTAGAPILPEPLVEQLKPGARLVIPIGPADKTQELMVIYKDMDGTIHKQKTIPVRFVPLVRTKG